MYGTRRQPDRPFAAGMAALSRTACIPFRRKKNHPVIACPSKAPLSGLRLLALLDGVITQKGMNAAYPIDHLGYAQVRNEAGERQGLTW
jgi:hypothetical protein